MTQWVEEVRGFIVQLLFIMKLYSCEDKKRQKKETWVWFGSFHFDFVDSRIPIRLSNTQIKIIHQKIKSSELYFRGTIQSHHLQSLLKRHYVDWARRKVIWKVSDHAAWNNG